MILQCVNDLEARKMILKCVIIII